MFLLNYNRVNIKTVLL